MNLKEYELELAVLEVDFVPRTNWQQKEELSGKIPKREDLTHPFKGLHEDRFS